ncbi:thiamine pyrophosphate-binding protein [Microbacterium soli]|uniref:Thiamine pyrophosphate-binding protein n=1 Tax=Microbacterium soli TaxID=446075 RepID=A0ABP7MSD9_9MICO
MTSSTGERDVAATVRRGRDALVDALCELGVTTVFGVMGDGNLSWLSIWSGRPGREFVSARHEASAVAMADGAAWHAHVPGVSTVTYGPGLLNAMNAMATAHRGGAGHVLITATPRASRPHHPQRYDHAALVSALGAVRIAVTDAERIAPSLRQAFRMASEAGILVVVDIEEECFDDDVPATVCEPPIEAVAPPALEWLPQIERSIRAAKRLLIVAGVGAERAGAASALVGLAESTGAWLSTTLPTRGLFAGHPQYLGNIGGFVTEQALPVIQRCDTVIAFGASLNEFTTDSESLLRGRTVIQIDRDAAALGRKYPIDVGVHSDARDAAEALAARFAGEGVQPPRAVDDMTVMRAGNDRSDDDGVDPRAAMQRLDAWLPDDRVVITDGGHFVEWPSRYLRAPSAGSFRTALAGGSIALGLSMGMGIARTDGSRRVAVVIGDGGLFMSLGDLETAVRERIPLIVVAMNDHAYSAEVHKLNRLGLPTDLAYFDDASDLSSAASGLGVSVVTARTPSDLDALPDADALTGPLLIDLRITRAVVSARLAR